MIGALIRAVKINFRQTGGFVGVDRGVALEAASLPADLRDIAESLLKHDAAVGQSSPGTRDQAQYYLRIEGSGEQRELRFDDETMPKELTDLVDHLRSQARPLPPE